MTPEERNALPVYTPFGCDVYKITDGTVTLPDGRVLRGLTGETISVPRYWNAMRCMDMDEIEFWVDDWGIQWRTVQTEQGLQRAPV